MKNLRQPDAGIEVPNETTKTNEAPLAPAQGSAKRRSTQCQCCASPLGELVQVESTERVICRGCMGFIAMWWIELGNLDRKSGGPETTGVTGDCFPDNPPNDQAHLPPDSGGGAQNKGTK